MIIGGTKFIGPYVVKMLHQCGHDIMLFHRGETDYTFPFPVHYIKGDRIDLSTFKKKFSAYSPDVVIDMIPYSEADGRQLINTFRGVVQRIVIISSCDVYSAFERLWNRSTDTIMPVPLTEKSALRTHYYPCRKADTQKNDWAYGYDKILVENIIRSCEELNSTILRLPMVYGPGDYSRIYSYLKRMDDHRFILLDENKAKWRACRAYVEDIAHAIVLAATDLRLGNRIYHVGEVVAYQESEWIQLIGQVANWNNELIKLPHDKLPINLVEPYAFEQDLAIDTTLIRQELGYQELYSPEESMKKSIDWIRSHHSSQIGNEVFDYNAEDNAMHGWKMACKISLPCSNKIK